MKMSDEQTCPECGAVLPSDAPRGLCPDCLFAAGAGDPGEQPPPEAGPAEIANDFGDHELLEEIAHGGMGVVYKARQRSLDRVVAIKMIRSERLAREAEVRRFRQEAAAAAKLQHPNIVAVHEAGEVAGQHFYSMDFVEGRSLAALVAEHPLGARQAAAYVKTIAEAIHYAHSQGVLHRDLKPSNILIDAHDAPRVTDFGLAKVLQSGSEVTLTGQVMGSPSYMSPEQAAGRSREVDARTDVYALGAILYELVSGRPPFKADTSLETLKLVVESEPVSPRLLIPRLPRDLETICLKCLEKERSRRYASAQILSDELGRFLNQEPILARPVGRAGKVWKWCRRQPTLAGLGAALLLTFLLGAAGVLWGWRRATTGELLARQNAYAADMVLTQRALVDNDTGQALRLLRRHRPGAESGFQNPKSEPDLRNWEWRYLWQLCQPDESVRLQLQSAPAGQVFISQNGRILAVRTGADKIEVWDLVSKKLLKEMQGFSSTTILGLSPNGGLLAAHRDGARTSEVWDLAAGRLRATLDLNRPSAPRSLAFSPDARLLATFDHHGSNGIIRVVDWAANRTLTNFTTFPPRRSQEGVVAFSPDGNRLAFENDHGTIRVVRWPACDIIPIPTETTDGVTALAFSSDSRLLAAGFAYTSGTIRLWDADSGEPRGQLTNHTGWIRALAFSPGGQQLASASQDRTIRLWRVADQTELHHFQGHFVTTLSFLPDGRTLVSSGEDGSACFWDVNAGGRASPPIVIPISCGGGEAAAPVSRFGIAFTPDSRSFITTDTNGSLAVWDAKKMQPTEALARVGDEQLGRGALAAR